MLVSPKLPEHHQFQHTWSVAFSLPWARSLYIRVLLVPSLTAGERQTFATQPSIDGAADDQWIVIPNVDDHAVLVVDRRS